MVRKSFEELASYSSNMDQNVEHERPRAYNNYTYSYPMVPQNYPAAGPAGTVGSQCQSSHQQQLHQLQPQQKQQFSGHFDGMSFQTLQHAAGAPVPYPYMHQYTPMTPYQMHPTAASDGPTYYQPMFSHPVYPGGYMQPFQPSYTYMNPQTPYPQMPLSPVQSNATSVGSPGFSVRQEILSPATTIASKASKKKQRTSPVIARTPLNFPTTEEDLELSSTMSSFSGNSGATNVYIKGLPSTMTDRELKDIVSCFGDIISSKAIIDRPSGICKGFGFAKFVNYENAEDCIKDLKQRGWEPTIARDSFYSRLKDLADLESTNLYVSNLPPNWDEARITDIFVGYEPTKCRLLVQYNGRSRGVAFVTFKDRNICDEIIERFNGRELKEPGHHLSLQVRYADTVAQKKLKKEKKEAGQFPKRSVLENHHNAVQAGHQKNIMMGAGQKLSASDPLHRNQGWTKKEVPTVPEGVNAPPTPPQSVISTEEDSNTKSEKEDDHN